MLLDKALVAGPRLIVGRMCFEDGTAECQNAFSKSDGNVRFEMHDCVVAEIESRLNDNPNDL